MNPKARVVISGCEEGSFEWFHERRHAFQEEKIGGLSQWRRLEFALKIAGCAVVPWSLGASVTLFMLSFFSELAFEFDANLYAIKMTGRLG